MSAIIAYKVMVVITVSVCVCVQCIGSKDLNTDSSIGKH